MGLCIPREYQTLSSFETNVLLAYQLHPLLQASTTNAFLCVCSQNFLTTRPHSVRNSMFIVQIMYRRCNFNVTFSKQKLLDVNIKAVWLNGLYCELVDLADVDIVLRLTQVPSWHLDYPNICSQSTGTSLFSIVLYVPYVWEISVTSAGGERGEGWQTIGCHGYTLTCTQCSLFAYYLHFSQLAMYMQCSYMYQYFLDWGPQNP